MDPAIEMSTTDDLDEECKDLPGEPTGAGAPHRTSGRSLDRERRVATLLAEVLDVAAENRLRALEAKETSPEVIDRVLGILERGPGDFMAESPLGRLAEPATAEPDSERAVPGGGPPYPRIQGYEVTGLLGEGGMGRVFLGVQRSADRRPVAIKMIRASVPGAELVRRFEAERQALSRLNHPAIAQLFGAGEAADGRHFVALEYVDGLPITAYCDRNRLDVRGRLEIFIEVCRGVEHAHRRQLLHRDLKPSNLMVTRRDGRPVPKVIDFGIARPLDSDGDPTVHTGASILGSPAYMSPEAVGPSGGPRDLDTRADVYSLGVVLYELLVGVRPHGPRSSHDPLTLIRRIRDEEAPRPSSRWRALDDSTRRAFAERRGLSEPLARKVLAGDLDWITMKAIAKDREQRYGSVAELAADLERYLRDEPVSAGPPTWGYRLGKFVRRRRWLAANVALASLSLLTAVLASGVGLVRARDAARQEAEARMDAEAALDFLVRLFEASAPHAVDNRKPADQVTARELLERGSQHIETELVDQPQEAARLRRILARSYRSLGLYDEALEHLEAARARLEALEPSIEVDSQLASVLRSIGAIAVKEARPEAALDVLDRAEALTSARPAASDHDLELSLIRGRKAAALRLLARFDEAESEMKKVLALHASMPEETAHHLQVSSLNNLGMLYFQQGRWAEAEPLFARAADLARRR
ncbi:MAG: serine/threonine-protein kinase, partial [Acidobacteriota bacterium]